MAGGENKPESVQHGTHFLRTRFLALRWHVWSYVSVLAAFVPGCFILVAVCLRWKNPKVYLPSLIRVHCVSNFFYGLGDCMGGLLHMLLPRVIFRCQYALGWLGDDHNDGAKYCHTSEKRHIGSACAQLMQRCWHQVEYRQGKHKPCR